MFGFHEKKSVHERAHGAKAHTGTWNEKKVEERKRQVKIEKQKKEEKNGNENKGQCVLFVGNGEGEEVV